MTSSHLDYPNHRQYGDMPGIGWLPQLARPGFAVAYPIRLVARSQKSV